MFVSKPNGTIDGHASYRAFGRSSVSGNRGERGFAGGLEIPSLGLVVLGPRVLDSDAGRFLSQDPVFNAVNLYAYAQGNPVFFWDPTGREISNSAAGAVYSTAYATGLALGVTFAMVAAPPVTVAWIAASIIGPHMLGLTFVVVADLTVVEPLGGPRADFSNLNPFGISVGTGGDQGEFGEGNVPIGWIPQIDDEVHEDSSSGGGGSFGLGGLGSLSFSIALGFGGAMW